MNSSVYNGLCKKLKSLHAVLASKQILRESFWQGTNLLCIEICNYFKNEECLKKYQMYIQMLFVHFTYMRNDKIYSTNLSNGPLKTLINEMISLKSDFPIWFLELVLGNTFRLYCYDNLLPKLFFLLSNDRSSRRQIAILNVIKENFTISVVQQFIKNSYNSDLEQLFTVICAEEDNEVAFRLFINKFNRITDNLMSFFCEAIEINGINLTNNEWVDFSKKHLKLTFLCPNKCLNAENVGEDSDIITLNLSFIVHLKFKSDDTQNFALLILELNNPCTGLLKSSSEFLKLCRSISFKVSKDVEQFRNFIVDYFKITPNVQDFELDINNFKLIDTISGDVISNTPTSPENNISEELMVESPCELTRSLDISVQETEYDPSDAQPVYFDSQNDPTNVLSAIPEIRNTCISVAETVEPHTSNSGFPGISCISLDNWNRELLSGLPQCVPETPVLTIRTPEVINNFTNISGNKTDDRTIKKRGLTTITNSFVLNNANNRNTFPEGSIDLSNQENEIFEVSQAKEKQLVCVTNPDVVSINCGTTQNTQTQTGEVTPSPNQTNGSFSGNETQTSQLSAVRKRRRSKLPKSSSAEYKVTSFFSSSYKSQGEEVRTRTRIIKKPDFYESCSESEANKKRKKKKKSKFSAAKRPLAISPQSWHSEPPVKRIKTLLPLIRVSSTQNSTVGQKQPFLISTTQTSNISEHNHQMDEFDRMKLGLPLAQSTVARKLSFSPSSQSTPNKNVPKLNLSFSFDPSPSPPETTANAEERLPQIVNPNSPISVFSSPVSPEKPKENNSGEKKRRGRQPKRKIDDELLESLFGSPASPAKPKGRRGRPRKNKAVEQKQEKIPKKRGRKRKVDQNLTLSPDLNFSLSSNIDSSFEDDDDTEKHFYTELLQMLLRIRSLILAPSKSRLRRVNLFAKLASETIASCKN